LLQAKQEEEARRAAEEAKRKEEARLKREQEAAQRRWVSRCRQDSKLGGALWQGMF